MKTSNVFWGVILILLGSLFILDNLDIVDFAWHSIWRLWPVVLVLWGVSIIPVKDWIKLSLVVLIVGATVMLVVDQSVYWEGKSYTFEYYHDNDDYDYDAGDMKNVFQDFTVPLEDSVETVVLNMDAAAGAFYMDEQTADLLSFSRKGSTIDYTYSVKRVEGETEIRIEPDESIHLRKNNRNRINLGLNPYPVWEVNMDVGAAAVDFDLSPFKVSELDIDGGAASFKIKLGDKNPETRVSIDAGASSIHIKVPEESGCDLRISTVLSGKHISGFDKIDHGHYQTSNFEEAENKIYLNVDAAVSSYNIIRY